MQEREKSMQKSREALKKSGVKFHYNPIEKKKIRPLETFDIQTAKRFIRVVFPFSILVCLFGIFLYIFFY